MKKMQTSAKKSTTPLGSFHGKTGWDNQPPPDKSGFEQMRFLIKMNETKKVCFVTGEPFWLKEHDYKSGGHWGAHMSCVAETRSAGCPLCLDWSVNKKLPLSPARHKAAFQLVDMTGWVSKKGETRGVNEALPLVITGNRVAYFHTLATEYAKGDLSRTVWVVKRTDEKNGIGNLWMYKGRYSGEAMTKKFGSECDLMDFDEMFALPSEAVLKVARALYLKSESVSTEAEPEVLEDEDLVEESTESEKDAEEELDEEEELGDEEIPF